MTLNDWRAIEDDKAARIKALLLRYDDAPDGTCTLADAARILPLVGWDVDLAHAYRAEELAL
jgi:hypothetical protein